MLTAQTLAVQLTTEQGKPLAAAREEIAYAAHLGPVQSRVQFACLQNLLEDCRKQGHRFLTGGAIDTGRRGYLSPVTVVDNPPVVAPGS